MKKILGLLMALAAINCNAETEDVTIFDNLQGETVTLYKATAGIERIELVTPYMTRREADLKYEETVSKFENNESYSRLNGSKSQVLFMEHGNINRNVLIARLRSVFGYRVVVAYDNFNEKED